MSLCWIAKIATNYSMVLNWEIKKIKKIEWEMPASETPQGRLLYSRSSLIMMTNGRGNLLVHPNKDELLLFSSFHSDVIGQHKQSSGEYGETIQFNYLHHFKWLIGVGGSLKKLCHFQEKKNNLFIFGFLMCQRWPKLGSDHLQSGNIFSS